MSRKLPPSYDWKARKIENWNATTFRQYLKDQHKERFGLPYVVNNWGMHQKQVKLAYEEFGKAETKMFIDLCFAHLRPKPPYNCLNFTYLYSYYKERFMNQAILKVRQGQRVKHQTQQQEQEEPLWF